MWPHPTVASTVEHIFDLDSNFTALVIDGAEGYGYGDGNGDGYGDGTGYGYGYGDIYIAVLDVLLWGAAAESKASLSRLPRGKHMLRNCDPDATTNSRHRGFVRVQHW